MFTVLHHSLRRKKDVTIFSQLITGDFTGFKSELTFLDQIIVTALLVGARLGYIHFELEDLSENRKYD